MSNVTDLKGQVAAVTGGGRGIGRAIAQALAAAGAAVAVLARSQSELAETVALIEKSGGRARAFPADVTDAASVRSAFSVIESALGPVDVLVNNAGTIGPIGPFWENDPEQWWRALDVNLRGPMLCCHAVLPGMIARRRGRIINVSSGAGVRAFNFLSSYLASKTALLRFAESLALEAKSHGVSVFALGPGTVRTAMAEHSLNSPDGRKWIPWFGKIFEEGLNVPPERPAQLALAMASGRLDALSGCFLTVADDLDAILANAANVEKEKLYTLGLRGPEQKPNPAFDKIVAAARRPS